MAIETSRVISRVTSEQMYVPPSAYPDDGDKTISQNGFDFCSAEGMKEK
jgi:hypothetical protein